MKKKRKILTLLFTCALAGLFTISAKAQTITLEEIANAFNDSNLVKTYQNYGYEMNATGDEESKILAVTLTTNENTTTVSYKLEEDILSHEKLTEDNLITAYVLADSIGKLQGYEDGELLENFSLFYDEINQYTVENEGFEIIENNGEYSVKMNRTKKVPLIDISKFYLKPDHFSAIKEIIEEGTTGNQNGRISKLVYDLIVRSDQNYIYIGEVDSLTDSAYQSILSALEVMYGNKVVEYFKSIYPGFEEGSYVLEGFTIDVDYEIDTEEHPIYSGTKVVLVTIDNEFVNDEILRTEYIGETIDRGKKSLTIDFITNHSYKLNFFDSASSSDAAFLFKYILEPVFIDADVELEGDTIYYNVVENKIVLGDKDNSIFKLVINEDYLEILPTNVDVAKTSIIATMDDVKVKEYEEGKSSDHYRYGKYTVTTNITYGPNTNYKVLEGPEKPVDINKDELTFKFDIEYSKFLEEGKVYVDGQLVDSSNYTAKEGSTIITLNANYVKSLSLKEHTLKVIVADGEVETKFTLTTSNPKTGDNIVLYISLLVISISGLVGTRIYTKKKIMNE